MTDGQPHAVINAVSFRWRLSAGRWAAYHEVEHLLYLRKRRLSVQQYPVEGKDMLTIEFAPLVEPTREIAEAFSRWENDPTLIPLSRPNRTKEDLDKRHLVTLDDMVQRLNHQHIYLIYLDAQLIGEMSYQVDPKHLFKQEPGTAWIGITIGEAHGRGKGIGYQSLLSLEQQIIAHGLGRIELGVFEFNTPALRLYHKLNYREIGRIKDFTYWRERMWQDIRMEKYLRA
jgi:RimJ/RimL family protein N-acetyltransferase